MAALLLAVTLAAPALFAQPATSSNRFLFIIDTSAAMKPLEMPLRETVFDLLYSGARGRMTNGDTYGVWLVNDQNDTSFAMDAWKQRHTVELAATAVAHIKDHSLKGKARLDVALADALRIIKNVDDLTVILVSNGETPLVGTPFDEAINARFAMLAPEMKRTKTTLNTALVAQNGEFVAWAVNSPEFLIEIPSVAPKPKPVKVRAAVAKTNAPAIVAAAAPPAPVVEKPRVTTSPIIITKETVAQERRTYAAMTLSADPVIGAATTNSVPASVAVTVIAPATNSAVVASTNTVKSVASETAAVAPRTNVAPAAPEVVTAKPEPANAPAASVSTPPPAAPLAELPSTPTTSRSLLWAITGGSLALAGVFGVMLLSRSRRPEASLISQSLAQERLHMS